MKLIQIYTFPKNAYLKPRIKQKIKIATRFGVTQPAVSDSDIRILPGHHGHHQGGGGGGGPPPLQGAGPDGDGRAQLSGC